MYNVTFRSNGLPNKTIEISAISKARAIHLATEQFKKEVGPKINFTSLTAFKI